MEKNKFGYKVVINQRCENEIIKDEEFGYWERSSTKWFKKILKMKDSFLKAKKFHKAISDFDFKKDEMCYIVWCEYISDYPFQTAKNKNIVVVGIFKDKACAKEIEKQYRKYTKENLKKSIPWDDKYKFYFRTSDEQEFQYCFCPWYGSFDSLSNVYVETAVVK